MDGFVLFAEFRNLCHNGVSNFFVRAQSIRLRQMLAQVHQLTKMNANHILAIPVARHLLRQTVTQPRDEHRYYLRLCLQYQLSYPRLRAQKTSELDLAPELLQMFDRELAQHVGPIAHALVRRAAQRAKDPSQLIELLAAEIDDAEGRADFVAAVRKLGATSWSG